MFAFSIELFNRTLRTFQVVETSSESNTNDNGTCEQVKEVQVKIQDLVEEKESKSAMTSNNGTSVNMVERSPEYLEMCSKKNQEITSLKEKIATLEQQMENVRIENSIFTDIIFQVSKFKNNQTYVILIFCRFLIPPLTCLIYHKPYSR